MLSSRGFYFIGFLFCSSMLAVAAYFQFIDHLEPCPLCILQRVITLCVAVILLLAVIHNPKALGIKIYGVIAALFSLVGVGIASRHVWLQNLPEDQVPSCGPGLEFMIKNFPLNDAINMVLKGSGECAEVVWTFIGLSIPAWTLVAFLLLILLSLSQVIRTQNRV